MIQANSLNIPLKDESVQCVVTSPPYWGLRDYGTATWEGGKNGCDHIGIEARVVSGGDGKQYTNIGSNRVYSGDCKCGAKRIDNQLGLEKTPEEYVLNCVRWAREVWRVLRPDGTFFLNLGDSYATQPASNGISFRRDRAKVLPQSKSKRITRGSGHLKPKDLCEIPSDVVRALRADGWYLRSRMPWVKRSAMPESCTDRPASALEYMFLLTKSQKCFFDMDAIRKKHAEQTIKSFGNGCKNAKAFGKKGNQDALGKVASGSYADGDKGLGRFIDPRGRNFRNTDLFYQSLEEPHGAIFCGDEMVGLDVNPQAYKEAHFATFPDWLVTPLIKAGTSEKGACPECGAPWERVVEKSGGTTGESWNDHTKDSTEGRIGTKRNVANGYESDYKVKTIGWQPTCKCYPPKHEHLPEPVPCVVLDPFGGSGTTKNVADRLGRRGVICELKMEYIEMAKKRCQSNQGALKL